MSSVFSRGGGQVSQHFVLLSRDEPFGGSRSLQRTWGRRRLPRKTNEHLGSPPGGPSRELFIAGHTTAGPSMTDLAMYFDDYFDQFYVEESDYDDDYYDGEYYDDDDDDVDDYTYGDSSSFPDRCRRFAGLSARNAPLRRAASEESSESEAAESSLSTLYDAALNVTARMLPFESVEIFSNHVKRVPEDVQLSIMKAAFPQKKAIISQYAHLSRKSPGVVRDYCSKLSRWTVKEGKQIGMYDFHKSRRSDHTCMLAPML